MKILSFLCYAFAFLDVALCNYFDIDITGVIWSPIVAAGLGWFFSRSASSGDNNKEETSQ